MSRLHESLLQHIHGELCSEVNDMLIRIKLHYLIDGEKRLEIVKAGKMPPEPTASEIVDLLIKSSQ
jgi:hypothetical protein